MHLGVLDEEEPKTGVLSDCGGARRSRCMLLTGTVAVAGLIGVVQVTGSSRLPMFVGGNYNWVNPHYSYGEEASSVQTLQQTPDPQGAVVPYIQDGGGEGPVTKVVGNKETGATKVTVHSIVSIHRTYKKCT